MAGDEISRALRHAPFVHPNLLTRETEAEIERRLEGRRDLVPIVAVSPWAALRFAAGGVSAPAAANLCSISKALALLPRRRGLQSGLAGKVAEEAGNKSNDARYLSSAVRDFFRGLRAQGVEAGEVIRRQAPYLGTAVSLNPGRAVRLFAVDDEPAPCIGVWYEDAARVADILANRTSFDGAMARAKSVEIRSAPLLAVVPDRIGCWLVTRYCGATLSDAQRGPTMTDLSGLFARLLNLFRDRSIVWSDFSPRNIVMDESGSLWAVDFERFRGFGSAWCESDYERIYLTWQSVLGEMALKEALAGRYDPDSLDIHDSSPSDPDDWDAEWLKQESVERESKLSFTRGLKRRLMQISFKIERIHALGKKFVDGHILCCYITDHAGVPTGVLTHRLLADAWNRDRASFADIVEYLAETVSLHRGQSAFSVGPPAHVLSRAVGRILRDRRRNSRAPLETVRCEAHSGSITSNAEQALR